MHMAYTDSSWRTLPSQSLFPMNNTLKASAINKKYDINASDLHDRSRLTHPESCTRPAYRNSSRLALLSQMSLSLDDKFRASTNNNNANSSQSDLLGGSDEFGMEIHEDCPLSPSDMSTPPLKPSRTQMHTPEDSPLPCSNVSTPSLKPALKPARRLVLRTIRAKTKEQTKGLGLREGSGNSTPTKPLLWNPNRKLSCSAWNAIARQEKESENEDENETMSEIMSEIVSDGWMERHENMSPIVIEEQTERDTPMTELKSSPMIIPLGDGNEKMSPDTFRTKSKGKTVRWDPAIISCGEVISRRSTPSESDLIELSPITSKPESKLNKSPLASKSPSKLVNLFPPYKPSKLYAEPVEEENFEEGSQALLRSKQKPANPNFDKLLVALRMVDDGDTTDVETPSTSPAEEMSRPASPAKTLNPCAATFFSEAMRVRPTQLKADTIKLAAYPASSQKWSLPSPSTPPTPQKRLQFVNKTIGHQPTHYPLQGVAVSLLPWDPNKGNENECVAQAQSGYKTIGSQPTYPSQQQDAAFSLLPWDSSKENDQSTIRYKPTYLSQQDVAGSLKPWETANENGPGRVAAFLEPSQAIKVLGDFTARFPLTGHHWQSTLGPATPKRPTTPSQVKHAADIQQRLEFLLLQQKEKKAALKLPPFLVP